MPTLQDGPAGRRAVNAPLLASSILASHATAAFVESVNARPGEALQALLRLAGPVVAIGRGLVPGHGRAINAPTAGHFPREAS